MRDAPRPSLHRFWLRRRRQAIKFNEHLGEQFETNFLERFNRLAPVWRFVVSWLLLFVLLGGCTVAQLLALRGQYQTLQPVPGGIYSEGIEGQFTTASPLYAVNEVDTSVSRLLFAGLLKYDEHNHLTGDLADGWSANSSGTVYTVHLRPGLVWQDGQPLTASDVAFTYRTIQQPDVNSPLRSSWQGVTVAATGVQTVTFTLPNPLSSFPYALTNGIVPQHILAGVNVADLRSAAFNTNNPIGAGPFRWASLGTSNNDPANAEQQISLVPFEHYWAGKPHLSAFSIHTFTNHQALIGAYRDRTILAVAGLHSVPPDFAKDDSSVVYNLPLTAATMVFFKTTQGVLNDVKVRQALVAAADRAAIVAQLGYPVVPVNEPLLVGQLGYDTAFGQQTNRPAQAGSLLDAAGWSMGPKGIRTKNGQPLTFNLSVDKGNDEYIKVAKLLSKQWRAVGVDARVLEQVPADFQSALSPQSSHSYDAVLYGIAVGADPDVFVYWDSSQADVRSQNRLNFSEYKSNAADVSLEAGRTRLDSQLRAIKYKSFLKTWQADAPALGLYQPRFLYISHTPVYGLSEHQINSDAERYDNVYNWMIHTGWVTNP